MKRILASVTLLLAAMGPVASSENQPPAPEAVEAILVLDQTATLRWFPPDLPADQLAGASYRVYGIDDGENQLLTVAAGVMLFAVVEGGHQNYGVSIVVDGVESVVVKACVSVYTSPPFVQSNC